MTRYSPHRLDVSDPPEIIKIGMYPMIGALVPGHEVPEGSGLFTLKPSVLSAKFTKTTCPEQCGVISSTCGFVWKWGIPVYRPNGNFNGKMMINHWIYWI
jgi:hypothetical protein